MDPVLKTENKVATLKFLRQYATIPVPGFAAWDSLSDNELGFEWIIMEKAKGMLLARCLKGIGWPQATSVLRNIAGILTQLRNCHFSGIRGIYLKASESRLYIASLETSNHDRIEEGPTEQLRDQVDVFEDLDFYPDFVIGRTVRSPFDFG